MKLTVPALLLVTALILEGCGFHPLYAVPEGGHGSMQAHLQSVYVAPLADRLGYELRGQVIDMIDGSSVQRGARYTLTMTLETKSDAIGVQSQKVGSLSQTIITRYNDHLTVKYKLVDNATGKMLTQGTETGLSAYNVVSSPYATLVAQQNADKQAAGDIADRIRIALAAYFARAATQPAAPAP